MKQKLNYVVNFGLGIVVGIIYRILCQTWRYELEFINHNGSPLTKNPSQSFILSHWHGDIMSLVGLVRYMKLLTLASQSKDGTIITAALKTLGYKVARGSSSRGGAQGLIHMIQHLRKSHYFVALAVDGPRGPRFQAKPGVYILAKKTNIDVFQLLAECSSRWDFPKSWAKEYLPKPFAKIKVKFIKHPPAANFSESEFLSRINSHTSF